MTDCESAILAALSVRHMTYPELCDALGHRQINSALNRLMEQKRVRVVEHPMSLPLTNTIYALREQPR